MQKVGSSSLIVYHPDPEEATVCSPEPQALLHAAGTWNFAGLCFSVPSTAVVCFIACTALPCSCPSCLAGLMEYDSVPRYTNSKTWEDDTGLIAGRAHSM